MEPSAANPANGLFVYRQRKGSYWQLFAASLSRGGSAQLTFGDCNAYSPLWNDAATLLYISDCGRGMGLGAVAISHPVVVSEEPGKTLAFAILAKRSQGEAQR
jgi:hypothetical protein